MPTLQMDPVVRDLSEQLLPHVDAYAARMADRIREHEPLYREGVVVTPAELHDSCRENLTWVLRRLAGDPGSDSVVPRVTGARRADAGVPLSSVLQAYRIGGRLIWELLVEAADDDAEDRLLRNAADIWAVSDELAEAASESYRAISDDKARHDVQLRSALLGSLLEGKVAEGSRLWESVVALKLPLQGSFAVVAAECPTPGEEGLPHIETGLRSLSVSSVWRVDADLQEGVVTLSPRFTLEQLGEELARRAIARVGLSEPFTSLTDAPAALRQAQLAAASGTPGTRDLVRSDLSPIPLLLISDPDRARDVATRVLGTALDLPADDRGTVLETARVWIASSGSTSLAAARLHLHRNSVRYRLRRLEELTGRSMSDPLQLSDIHVALECARMLALG